MQNTTMCKTTLSHSKLNHVLLFVSMFFSATVFSETYLVDFSQFENPGGNWNSLQSNQTTNISLIDDETGLVGAATLSHTFGGVDSNMSGGWTAGNVGWVDTAAVNDGIYSTPNTTMTISGLNNGQTYALDFVAVETAFPSIADFQVHGQFADSNRLGTNALGDDWDTSVDGLNNWLTWDAVSPINSSITLTVSAPGGYTTINAVRIRSVGTPNTPPTASGFSANPTEGVTHIFSTSDFSYNDADADPLNHVLIEQLPGAGTLYVDSNNNDAFDSGEQLNAGSSVTQSNLDAGNLQYIQNGSSSTVFQFEVNDGIEYSSGNYLATLNLSAVPAVINSVNVPPSMTYVTNEDISFSVNFSKNVVVNLNGGTPSITITMDSGTVSAAYQSGSGSSTINFSYTIQAGDFDDNGIIINSLMLNGGTISSNGGLAANLTLNGVGNTSAVNIDGVAPRLQSVTRFNPSSSTTSADQVTLRYTFTEPVNNIQDSNFFSNNPSIISSTNSTPFTSQVYDVTFGGPNLAEFNGTIVFGFITAGVTDMAGNAMTSSNVIGVNENSYQFENLYFIGGTVQGLLSGNYLVLTNQGGDDKIITSNGPYVFDTPLMHNESYEVEIDLQPINPIQPCQLMNATSSINSSDVTDIDLHCELGTDLIYRNGLEQPTNIE